VDFQRIDPNNKIHMKVPLHFINADIAPGVKTSGGIVSHVLTEVDVTCLPKDLPEFITVDMKDLAAGHTIHLSELVLPENVEITALTKGDDQTVAAIVIPRSALAAGNAAEEEAAG
jgi:large subunit ribosomal protein L25